MEKSDKKIRVKILCLFVHDGKLLVGNRNSLKGHKNGNVFVPSDSYRLLGGTLDFNETAEQGMRREIREELGCEAENLELLEVFEDIYTYHDAEGHDIVFLFKADLADKSMYEKEVIHITEDTYEFDAVWLSVPEVLDGTKEVHPFHDYSKYFI